MQINAPEGKLTIDDTVLTFAPWDDHPTVTVGLDPMPDYRYERGVYGVGTLVIGGQTIVLRNEQAAAVVEELRRERAPKTATKTKRDSDSATSASS